MEPLPVCTAPLFKLCLSPLWCSYAIFLFLSCTSAMLQTIGVAAAASASGGLSGNETDRLSLLAFKGTITGDLAGGALGSWNDSLHYCQWRGVSCGRGHRSRVTVLNLSSLGLGGYISPSIANLTFLRVIDLRHNQLRGPIPPQLGSLSRLRHLLLRNNTLSEQIPTNLSRCSELEVLRLSNNQLTGEIPVALGSLPKLRHLGITSNQITGPIPPSLGNLSSTLFRALWFSNNAITGGIPSELGRLNDLKYLVVDMNNLSGTVPASLFNLSNLEVLDVSINKLSGTLPSDLGTTLPKLRHLLMGENQYITGHIPSSLLNASSLQSILLVDNMIEGTIPDNLGALKELDRINVAVNRLEAREPKDWKFLTSLTNCTHLRVISMTSNELRGPLPSSIANLSAGLEYLVMGANQISGSIPTGIENLVGLINLDIGENQLIGSIPYTLGKLNKLVRMRLHANQLSGEIPSELGNLTQLWELTLLQNNLSGSIPTSIARCKRLRGLYMSSNGLNGRIPEELFTFPTIVGVDLSNNYLEGPFPSKIGPLLSLRYLNLSANRLSGPLPTTLGDRQSIEELHLNRNSFEGTIPPSFRNLKGIEVMDISQNNLTGKIPEFLEDLKFLKYLNLSFNSFIGEVPKGGIFANASAISLQGNRNVCGGILKLRLPPCPLHEENGREGARTTKVIITTVVAGVCIVLFVCFIVSFRWMRKSKEKKSSTSLFESQLQRISYHDLFKVTDGFSPNNLIGMGSFGSVYKGILDGGRTVAVKVIDFQRQGALKSFKSECEALRSIRHRNLVKIISVCSSINLSGQEFKALVYEFFPNGSLEKWLYSEQEVEMRTLDFVQRLSIAADIASALDYLHNHSHSPIVHCDLKPSNVLLDDNMTAHVGDFGLARIIPRPSSQNFENSSSTIGIMGSIGYVPPEYGMGSPVSTCGDVYSFGILLLELFTVKRPVDDMFKVGLSLRKFVEVALAERVMDIVDPQLLPTNDATEPLHISLDNGVLSREEIRECLVSLMKIGLDCTREVPRERMTMGDVVKEIKSIQKSYLKFTKS